MNILLEHEFLLKTLKDTLDDLREFPSGKSQFVSNFGREIGREVPRNFVNKVLSGEKNFTKERQYRELQTAIEVANRTLNKVSNEEKRRILYNKFEILEADYSIDFLDEEVNNIDILAEKGDYLTSSKSIKNLERFIKPQKLMIANPFIFANYNLIYSKIQMQLGDSYGETGSFNLVDKSIRTFGRLNEPKKFIQSIIIKGQILRQLKNYALAIQYFETVEEILENHSKLSMDETNYYLHNMQHQKAVTFMLWGKYEISNSLFNISNQYFVHNTNPSWSRFASIREAELLVKNNKLIKADSILDRYEDYTEIATMTTPHRVIFLRVNAERYLKEDDIKNCLKNFKAAVTISLEESYTHELEKLNRLYCESSEIKKNLSENFTVYNPIWN